ncbi:hypothetical protein HDU87_005161 [Geranomyces variabilis]|uniref:Aminotransferase class I/classII large domain-containing protein n=1 Tax=Geranomyces variabilis TaxID=109894 RepID=A0AAD5XVG3_9FUNG|nr:hypothetical protein HDU87_005161 [Geranomyces variabilis]
MPGMDEDVPSGAPPHQQGILSSDAASSSSSLSTLARNATAKPSLLLTGLSKALANPYHHTTSPLGIINLGTAENHLCFPELLEKFNSPEIRITTPDMLTYGNTYGSAPLLASIADLFNEFLRPCQAVVPADLTVHAGCGATISNVAQALTDPGDGILIPCPFYGGFDFDLTLYAQAKLVHVETSSHDNFLITPKACETAYANAVAAGTRVRVLLLTNPSNPTGLAMGPSEILSLLEWAKGRNLHVVSDEIYALSTWSNKNPFVSVLALPTLPDPQRTHVVWSFSKDFGSNGIRVGVFFSRDRQLLKAMHMFSILTNTSSLADRACANLLSDRKWVAWYVEENKKRMRESFEKTATALKRMRVPYIEPDSGFFVFVNLSRWIAPVGDASTTSHGPPSESAGWRGLWNRLIDAGIYILPGEAFSCRQPGFFRIVHTLNWDVVRLGLERLERVLDEVEVETASSHLKDMSVELFDMQKFHS